MKELIDNLQTKLVLDEPETAAQNLALAKDILALLDLGCWAPTRGILLSPDRPWRARTAENIIDSLLSSSCELCARGAGMVVLFLARYGNGSTLLNRYNAEDGRIEAPTEMYSSTWRLIEAAFEGHGPRDGGHVWCSAYTNNRERLRALMQRMVDNGGKFGIYDRYNTLVP